MGPVAQLSVGETMFPPRAPFFPPCTVAIVLCLRANESPFGCDALRPTRDLHYPAPRSGMGPVAQLVFKTSAVV